MKIVDRKAFLTLPAGTVFAKYEPCCFENLLIKEKSLENDFFYTEIVDAIDCNGSDEFSRLLEEAESKGANLTMDFDNQGRDGCYDEKQLFAVFEKEDVEKLIKRLQETLAST